MIEGTRQFKGGGRAEKNDDNSGESQKDSPLPSSDPTIAPQSSPEISTESDSDAVNLRRREWFQSLVPAFGDGLVKLLRASNNLQRDLHETLKSKVDSISEPESAPLEIEQKD